MDRFIEETINHYFFSCRLITLKVFTSKNTYKSSNLHRVNKRLPQCPLSQGSVLKSSNISTDKTSANVQDYENIGYEKYE